MGMWDGPRGCLSSTPRRALHGGHFIHSASSTAWGALYFIHSMAGIGWCWSASVAALCAPRLLLVHQHLLGVACASALHGCLRKMLSTLLHVSFREVASASSTKAHRMVHLNCGRMCGCCSTVRGCAVIGQQKYCHTWACACTRMHTHAHIHTYVHIHTPPSASAVCVRADPAFKGEPAG